MLVARDVRDVLDSKVDPGLQDHAGSSLLSAEEKWAGFVGG
jgi:hypothetical protein